MNAGRWTTGSLAEELGCPVKGTPELELRGAAPIEEAGPNDLTFLANPRYRKHLGSCRAGAMIISPDEKTPAGVVRIESPNPYSTFRRALELLYPTAEPDVAEGVHPLAVVDSTARLGRGVRVGPFVEVAAEALVGHRVTLYRGAYVGRAAVVGDDCTLGVGAVLRHEVILGKRVVIGDGSVIGFDGFGYAPEPDGFHKIPQVGTVEIEDDVEIGANCCVDRATVGVTRIGRGTKLDNLIQVAHGVHIGAGTVIAGQTGISGSTTIGSAVMIGGQVGMVGHIEIGDGMIIGAQAGVTKSFDIKGMISGYPARPQMEAMRIEAALSQLPELIKRVRELEKVIKWSSDQVVK